MIPALPSQYDHRSNRQAATVGLKTTETPAGSCMPSDDPADCIATNL